MAERLLITTLCEAVPEHPLRNKVALDVKPALRAQRDVLIKSINRVVPRKVFVLIG